MHILKTFSNIFKIFNNFKLKEFRYIDFKLRIVE